MSHERQIYIVIEEPDKEGAADHSTESGEELKRYRKTPDEAALKSEMEGRVEDGGKKEVKRPEEKSKR